MQGPPATKRPPHPWHHTALMALLVIFATTSGSAALCIFVAAYWAMQTAVRATSPHPALPAGEHVDAVPLAQLAPNGLAELLSARPELAGVPVYVSHCDPVAAAASPAGIVIGDEALTSRHAAAILAHELGHVIRRDWLRTGAWVATPSVILVAVAYAHSTGVARLPLAVAAVTAIVLTELARAVASRHHELAADRFAADAVGTTDVAASLRALVERHHTTSLFDTHPTLETRVAALAAHDRAPAPVP